MGHLLSDWIGREGIFLLLPGNTTSRRPRAGTDFHRVRAERTLSEQLLKNTISRPQGTAPEKSTDSCRAISAATHGTARATYLEASWSRFKVIMGPGKLDSRAKEFLALAVSTVNNCAYCIHAHTASLRRMGGRMRNCWRPSPSLVSSWGSTSFSMDCASSRISNETPGPSLPPASDRMSPDQLSSGEPTAGESAWLDRFVVGVALVRGRPVRRQHRGGRARMKRSSGSRGNQAKGISHGSGPSGSRSSAACRPGVALFLPQGVSGGGDEEIADFMGIAGAAVKCRRRQARVRSRRDTCAERFGRDGHRANGVGIFEGRASLIRAKSSRWS